jgi:hypothetical protein
MYMEYLGFWVLGSGFWVVQPVWERRLIGWLSLKYFVGWAAAQLLNDLPTKSTNNNSDKTSLENAFYAYLL